MTEKAIKDKTNQKVHLISSRPAGLPPHSQALWRAGEINRAVEAREIVAAEGPSSGEQRWPPLEEKEKQEAGSGGGDGGGGGEECCPTTGALPPLPRLLPRSPDKRIHPAMIAGHL